MIRTSLAVACLVLPLAGCAGAAGSPDAPGPVSPVPAAAPRTPSAEETASAGAQRYHATELRPGDCIEPMPTNFMVTVVACDVPHSAEFATTYVLADGPWPGADMDRLVDDGCSPRMRVKESERDVVGLLGLTPAQADWPRHRTVYCLAVPLDGEKITERVIK
ncbi:hypothetical protein [Nonomuraea sp. NPDC050691]|uniref:hypothetical protein n=1 Tax=Nonomuraea sp. NPDC050691 TaxID=3155661 RepID=UPI0033E8E565